MSLPEGMQSKVRPACVQNPPSAVLNPILLLSRAEYAAAGLPVPLFERRCPTQRHTSKQCREQHKQHARRVQLKENRRAAIAQIRQFACPKLAIVNGECCQRQSKLCHLLPEPRLPMRARERGSQVVPSPQ